DNRLRLTAAYFDEVKGSNIYSLNPGGHSYTFATEGEEEHKGVELGFTGKVTDDLTVYGGGTFMDAKLTKQPAIPTIIGQVPQGVSEDIEKLYVEYNVDMVPGLTITGGVQNYSKQLTANVNPAVAPGLKYIPGYAIGNIGARYEFVAYQIPM